MKQGLCAAALAAVSVVAQGATVFSTDFDGALPAEIAPGVATLTGVQGYAGLGPVGTQFGGSFLRSPTGNLVTLTLNQLPEHTDISLAFLFAAIDSLDGTGTFPQGDFLTITLDGQTLLRESFANATPDQIQSYVPPPGGELARRVDLGFSGPGGYYTDSAYNLGLEPRLQHVQHTASSAVFTFQIEGPGIQPLDDESWAMDQLVVSVNAVSTVPEPSAAGLGLVGLGALVALQRRRRRA